jgi:hypothetical protein
LTSVRLRRELDAKFDEMLMAYVRVTSSHDQNLNPAIRSSFSSPQ